MAFSFYATTSAVKMPEPFNKDGAEQSRNCDPGDVGFTWRNDSQDFDGFIQK